MAPAAAQRNRRRGALHAVRTGEPGHVPSVPFPSIGAADFSSSHDCGLRKCNASCAPRGIPRRQPTPGANEWQHGRGTPSLVGPLRCGSRCHGRPAPTTSCRVVSASPRGTRAAANSQPPGSSPFACQVSRHPRTDSSCKRHCVGQVHVQMWHRSAECCSSGPKHIHGVSHSHTLKYRYMSRLPLSRELPGSASRRRRRCLRPRGFIPLRTARDCRPRSTVAHPGRPGSEPPSGAPRAGGLRLT